MTSRDPERSDLWSQCTALRAQ